MNRTELVKTKAEEFSRLSDRELVRVIVSYFNHNRTMPGEKEIKDNANDLLKAIDMKHGTRITAEYRRELIERFSSLCVKEVKLKAVQAKNETKKNEGVNMPKAGDLPMELKDSEFIPVNTMKDTYEMPAMIFGALDDAVCVNGDTLAGKVFGSLPKGFRKNHDMLSGLEGTVIATDYSNGKFKNMSYSLLIDLSQGLTA